MLEVTGARLHIIDAATTVDGGSLLLDGAVVAEIGTPRPEGVETLDADGCVVTPGLVNAHHHLLQSAFRTLPGTRGVPMADWLPAMAMAYTAAGIDASLLSASAAVGVAEGLLDGVTTVADHHLNWPLEGSIDATVAIARATAEATARLGGRLALVRGSARDEPGRAAASAEAIVGDLVPGAVGGITANGMLQVAVGPAGVHSDSAETFAAFAEVAARHHLRRRTQANEQVDTAIAVERYGRRPLELLEAWGWLAPDVTIAHCCDVHDDEIRALAAAAVTVTHAPGCDVSMGWGIAPVHRMLDAGITVGLGTSGGGSNDAGHLLADARLAMQVSALVGPQLPARTLLDAATAGGAVGLGRPELGHLRPGAAADLCVWDVSGVADAGVADPVAGLLWANPGRRPRHVVVAGRVVVRDGRLVGADEADLVAVLRRRMGAAAA